MKEIIHYVIPVPPSPAEYSPEYPQITCKVERCLTGVESVPLDAPCDLDSYVWRKLTLETGQQLIGFLALSTDAWHDPLNKGFIVTVNRKTEPDPQIHGRKYILKVTLWKVDVGKPMEQ